MVKKKSEILEEGTTRTKGINALSSNIEAAKAISQILKSTLGPRGMDKMLIDSVGNSVITNDGVKILREMEVEHPGAKLLVDVAKTQESEVGDGTTTAVILSGELLKNAQKLIKRKIHPATIVRTYQKCAKYSLEILEKKSTKINTNDEKIMRQIVQTAMIGKSAEISKEHLSKLVFDAISFVKDIQINPIQRIKITKATGGNIESSSLVSGIVLDKNLAHPNMPTKIKNPKILLIDFPLEIRELEHDAKVQLNSYKEYENFIENEKKYLYSLVLKIKSIGCNGVICHKGIDDEVAYYLAKEGITAVRRVRRSDLEKLSFALNTNIVSSLEDIKKESLGVCLSLEQKVILNENYIFIEGCKNPKAITLFLKASTSHVLDELERAIEDSLGDLYSVLKSKAVVAGGGAIEVELYNELIKYSESFSGKQKIIAKSFAKSFLSIPKVLCENCGFETSNIMPKLVVVHKKGDNNAGIDGLKGMIKDTLNSGIVEPINVKMQAIKSASEASTMILRIDDIIAAKKLSEDNSEQQYMDY